MFKGMVPPGLFQATCVSGAPSGPNRVLQGQQKKMRLKKRRSFYIINIYIRRIRNFPPPTLGQPVHFGTRLGTPPPILGSGNTKKYVLEVNWMVISGYLNL